MRTYQETHPWLEFSLNLKKLDHTTWLLLGEATSKIEHVAGAPLEPDAAERLHEIYLAKGVLATTAIEGNTLTEEEVQRHLEGRLELAPSREYLKQEIDNVLTAYNTITHAVIRGQASPLSVEEIREYNRQVLHELPLQEDVVPGELRKHSVLVGRYRAVPAEDCEFLLGKFCRWLNELEFPDGMEQPGSILAAIAAHLYFVWIHPFGDGNGRTARLIEFRYLLKAGFPTPAAHLLSNFYNLTRTEYYRQLDKASRTGGQMSEFIAYAAQGLVDQLREQLGVIRRLQLDTTWQNFVYRSFGKLRPSSAQERRRRLVLDLSKTGHEGGWVAVSEISTLTPRLATEYARRTGKTLTRDLNAVMGMNLVEGDGQRVRARKNLILAFLPPRAPSE